MSNSVKCFYAGCQHMFTRVNDYITHLKSHDLEKPLRLVCTFINCLQKFTTMYRFSRHLKTHLPLERSSMEYEINNETTNIQHASPSNSEEVSSKITQLNIL